VSRLLIHHNWESALHESAEVSQTSAMLKIVLGNTIVTRNEDEWAQTVREDVRLSAYPLALWFASSWWRLRWESLPLQAPSHSWRMAHELRAAGFGYVWPRILFASEGDHVQVWAAQSASDAKAPVRYLESAYSEISAREFERTIDEFVNGVLARLDAVAVARTSLHDLWKEVVEERHDHKCAFDRQLEAMLGFDPDESPETLLDTLKNLIPKAGASAIQEIAPVCATASPSKTLDSILIASAANSPRGRFAIRLDATRLDASLPSWEQGRELAQQLRSRLSLNGSPVPDAKLSELIGLPPKVAIDGSRAGASPPLGLAIRGGAREQEAKFVFRRRVRPSRRFEIARLICDHAIADESDRWLPATDGKTSRQRIQRAFAAEFLCPIDPLIDFLGGDFTSDSFDEAAEHFGVSAQAVKSQLVNQDILPSDFLTPYDSRFDLPYSVFSRGVAVRPT
jgi:hypothetical protein